MISTSCFESLPTRHGGPAASRDRSKGVASSAKIPGRGARAGALCSIRIQSLSQCTQRVYTEGVHTNEAGEKQIPKSGQARAILGLVDRYSW